MSVPFSLPGTLAPPHKPHSAGQEGKNETTTDSRPSTCPSLQKKYDKASVLKGITQAFRAYMDVMENHPLTPDLPPA